MEEDVPITPLVVRNEARILLLVLDGLGGLPRTAGGPTELEAARTPHLDELARSGECGLHLPVGYGIAPGSAPGHLALFGYDPLRYPIGRGIVAALGIGYPVRTGDVAARLNFATRDPAGVVTDRRAGRIPTEVCIRLAALLDTIELPQVEVAVRAVRDYRAMVVFRGSNLSDRVTDTDPQATGVPARPPAGAAPAGAPPDAVAAARRTAGIAARFIERARTLLAAERPANEVLLRGFARLPEIPALGDRFGLRGVALAVYPDYKGVSRLVGMEALDELPDLEAQAAPPAQRRVPLCRGGRRARSGQPAAPAMAAPVRPRGGKRAQLSRSDGGGAARRGPETAPPAEPDRVARQRRRAARRGRGRRRSRLVCGVGRAVR